MSSETKRAFAEDGEIKTHIGGQALIEGIMMRGKIGWAAAIREPDGGVYVEEHPLSKKGARAKWLSWPLVRGCVALVDSLALGYKALDIAASHAYDEEGETYLSLQKAKAQQQAQVGSVAAAESNPKAEVVSDVGVEGDLSIGESEVDAGAENKDCLTADKVNLFTGESESCSLSTSKSPASSEKGATSEQAVSATGEEQQKESEQFFGKAEMAISMTLGIVLGVALFILAPAFVSNLIVGDYDVNPLAWNILDGVLRVAIFILYIWLISLMPDIHRMFCYHGAEHKTIHCFEHGLPLTPENAAQFPRLHVRCGTAFIVMVMLIAIVVYTCIPVDRLLVAWGITDSVVKFLLVVVIRILLMPVIAGVTYEITVKWAGSNPDNPVVKVVLWPGMQMQRLTTKEPDNGMLECAIAAMSAVIEQEKDL